MKFSADREQLLEAVNHLSRIVSNKTSLPVLEGILISAEQGKVTLISYNLEMGIKKTIYANTSEEGDIVINAKFLADVLRKMEGSYIEISSDSRLMCNISSAATKFEILGMSATDFPEMPSVSNETPIKIGGEIFKNMVRRTIFAVAKSEGTRPILTGIKVNIENDNIQFVAIDGYRLAIRKENTVINAQSEFIIAGNSVNEIVKLINDDNEDIEIYVGVNLISFNINGYTFVSRLLEGNFVDYKKSIAQTFKQRIFVKTRELINTIDRISPVISDAFSTPVRCIINEENILFSCSSALGRATENFPITLEGEPFEIGLNSRYLLEALRACECENIKIEFNGATSGVLIKDADSEEFIYMIMPMRLK